MFATFAPWVVALTGQRKTSLSCVSGSMRAENHASALRPDRSSIKMKPKQLRRGAPDQSRPLERRRTSEVLAEVETAVTETPRQTLSVLRRHNSLDMSRAVLQARPCATIDSMPMVPEDSNPAICVKIRSQARVRFEVPAARPLRVTNLELRVDPIAATASQNTPVEQVHHRGSVFQTRFVLEQTRYHSDFALSSTLSPKAVMRCKAASVRSISKNGTRANRAVPKVLFRRWFCPREIAVPDARVKKRRVPKDNAKLECF